MPIRFNCNNCGQLLKARDDKIGRTMPCPKCKAKVTVPGEDDQDAVRSGERKQSESEMDPFASLVVYDQDIVYETESQRDKDQEKAEIGFDRRLVAVSRRVLYGHAVLLLLIPVAGFAAGYLVGHSTRGAPQPVEAMPQRVVIDGRLQWEASTGLLADKGAVVIAVPESVEPQTKLPGESLGPDKTMPPKDDENIRTIENWGGWYTRTNDVGEFELFLLPGRYHVLVVSSQARRPPSQEPQRDHLAALGQYFTSPHELIGPFKYNWVTEDFEEESQLFHDFPMDE